MFLHSRDVLRPRFASKLHALDSQRARGMPDARAPAVSCAMCTESARMSIQGSGGNPTFPAQWLYGLLRDLPGDRLSCHHHRRDLTRQLDASTEASGPHVFAVRFNAVRQGTSASTATRPTS